MNIKKYFGKGGSVRRRKQDTVLDTCSHAFICMKCMFTDKRDRREKSWHCFNEFEVGEESSHVEWRMVDVFGFGLC